MTNINGSDADGAIAGPVAGETLKDRTRWPGYGLIALGLFAIASGLTALGTGNGGPAVAAFVIAVLGFGAGITWLVVGHRRLQGQVGAGTPERPEDAGPVA